MLAAGRPLHARAVLRHLTDAYLCAAALFLISWVVALRPLYADVGDSSTFMIVLLPALVSLMVTCAVGPVVITARSPIRPLGLAGFAVLAAASTGELAAAVARLGGVDPPRWSLLLAPVAFLLLAALPWSGRTSRVVHASPEESRPRAGHVTATLISAVPLVLVVIAAGALVVNLHGRPVTGVALVAASVVVILVIRVFVLITANARMRHLVSLGDRQLRELAESTGDVVLLCDYEGVVHEIGSGVEVTYGYHPDELVGGSIFDYIHPEDVPGIQLALRQMGLDEDPVAPGACLIACRVRAADGTWRPTESVAHPPRPRRGTAARHHARHQRPGGAAQTRSRT
ncbi:hypothetical protein GCM10020219_035240 [Nonomuraea dietziae]